MATACASCTKSDTEAGLKRCAKCQTTYYCSRDCQKADWKVHKKICGKQAGQGGSSSSASGVKVSPPKGLEQPIAKPFSKLVGKTWIHDRPEKDVFRLLVDAYRLRVNDDINFGGDTGVPDVVAGFDRFLSQASSRANLLPPWWSTEKQSQCKAFGSGEDRWCNLAFSVEKADIIDHYGDPQFPMQLRMFGEQVIGTGPGGQPGSTMMNILAGMEGGNGMASSMLDMSQTFR
ncbi:MYND finger domain-containing protein [Sarocladium implicatum]|nr:MYND finger domain-containing protein [Sarocladium implicatum]